MEKLRYVFVFAGCLQDLLHVEHKVTVTSCEVRKKARHALCGLTRATNRGPSDKPSSTDVSTHYSLQSYEPRAKLMLILNQPASSYHIIRWSCCGRSPWPSSASP